jgi:hypothetical protein
MRKDYVRQTKSPQALPILLVPKKNGELRLCVDFRPLNKIVVKEQNTFPDINTIMSYLYNKKIFSKLDRKSAYNQLRMHEGSQELTAFATTYGN